MRNDVGGHDVEPELELEVGRDGEQVGVAGSLAVAVDRALDVGGSGPHGRDELAAAHPVSLWQCAPMRAPV